MISSIGGTCSSSSSSSSWSTTGWGKRTRRHKGHVFWSSSQREMHFRPRMWPQGSRTAVSGSEEEAEVLLLLLLLLLPVLVRVLTVLKGSMQMWQVVVVLSPSGGKSLGLRSGSWSTNCRLGFEGPCCVSGKNRDGLSGVTIRRPGFKGPCSVPGKNRAGLPSPPIRKSGLEGPCCVSGGDRDGRCDAAMFVCLSVCLSLG